MSETPRSLEEAEGLLRRADRIMRGQHDPVEWLIDYNAYLARPASDVPSGGPAGLVEGWKNDKNLVRRNGWSHVFAFACESDTQAAYAASLLQNRDETIAALEARLNALTASDGPVESEWCDEHDWLASIYSGDLQDVIAERCRNCTAIQWNGEVFADAWNALAAIATTHAAAGDRDEGLADALKAVDDAIYLHTPPRMDKWDELALTRLKVARRRLWVATMPALTAPSAPAPDAPQPASDGLRAALYGVMRWTTAAGPCWCDHLPRNADSIHTDACLDARAALTAPSAGAPDAKVTGMWRCADGGHDLGVPYPQHCPYCGKDPTAPVGVLYNAPAPDASQPALDGLREAVLAEVGECEVRFQASWLYEEERTVTPSSCMEHDALLVSGKVRITDEYRDRILAGETRKTWCTACRVRAALTASQQQAGQG